MKSPQNLVISFIETMMEIRPDILFSFEYDQAEDRYRIFHSYASVHDDREFRRKMNQIYSKCFSDNSFYSVSIILNRQMVPFSFVNAHDTNKITIIQTNLENIVKAVDQDMKICSDEVSIDIDDWSVNCDDDVQTTYDLAA